MTRTVITAVILSPTLAALPASAADETAAGAARRRQGRRQRRHARLQSLVAARNARRISHAEPVERGALELRRR